VCCLQIHEHILIHGDIRKTTKMNIAGEEMEIETFVDEEEEGGVHHGTAELAHRASFQKMGDRLRAQYAPGCQLEAIRHLLPV
jgi:hypothetical protein